MASLEAVPNLDMAMNDLHGFVEDAQTASPTDFDDLQGLLRVEHDVPGSLHAIVRNLGRATDVRQAFFRTKGRLPGDRMSRSLLLYEDLYSSGEPSGVELSAIKHVSRFRSKMRTSLSLRDDGAPFDRAYVGQKSYFPYSGIIQSTFFDWADGEYEKAQAGQGDRAVAYSLMQEALRTAERGVDSEVQGYLATTAILTSSLLEAMDV